MIYKSDHLHSSMNSTSLAYRAYRKLEEMIVLLELEPGAILPENSICEMIGIGRTPVREALKRLADASLVSVIARRGVLITEIDVKQQLYLTEVRRTLEELVCGRAARRRDEQEAEVFRCIETRLIESEKLGNVTEFLLADRDFNSLVINAARNPYLAKAIAPLHSLSRRFWYVEYQKSKSIGGTPEDHANIVRAIVKGDEDEAIAASRAHMSNVENLIRRAMNLDM